MFGPLYQANRGEIAVRGSTLRRLGIRSVAVYSDPDVDARHVLEADRCMNRPSTRKSPISQGVDAAHRAQAIHPGYGSLARMPISLRRVNARMF